MKIIAALLASLLAFPTLAQDPVFKWRDASGTWKYGSEPPEGVEAQPMDFNAPQEGKAIQRTGAADLSRLRLGLSYDQVVSMVGMPTARIGAPAGRSGTLEYGKVSAQFYKARVTALSGLSEGRIFDRAALGVGMSLDQAIDVWGEPDRRNTLIAQNGKKRVTLVYQRSEQDNRVDRVLVTDGLVSDIRFAD